jgi:hypothetical protein
MNFLRGLFALRLETFEKNLGIYYSCGKNRKVGYLTVLNLAERAGLETTELQGRY